MRVIGLLSWYDEAPSWLAATITAAAPFVDHFVAVDGAYALYPDGRARSETTQAETILRVADAAGVGVTIHAPGDVWRGNEVEKRTRAFAYANLEAETDKDWVIVLDGDDVVSDIPADLSPRLKATDRNVAEVELWDRMSWIEATPEAAKGIPLPPITRQKQRRLYRAADEIVVKGSHFVYAARRGEDWSYLWGPTTVELEPAYDLSDLRIEHRSRHRDRARRDAAAEYYRIRDALGIEKTGARLMETISGEIEVVNG